MDLTHSPSCDSVGECTLKQLMEMPGFKGTMIQGLSSARIRVTEAVKRVYHLNVDHRPAMVYRAIARAEEMMKTSEDKYDKLPGFLNAFAHENPGSRVCCQLDSKGRFFRVFLSIGCLVATQDNWVPILECDGTHMKSKYYNGICVLLVGKTGNWENIPCAIVFIHKETADNFEWVFANCLAAGIKLQDRSLFCDRGKQREAQKRLKGRGFTINLKFCALHIFFNVCGHFRAVAPAIDSIRSLVFRLQASSSLAEYDEVLEEISERFPMTRIVHVGGATQEQSVADYLRKIHPTSWTRFGNGLLTVEEAEAFTQRWTTADAYGDGRALFDGRTTSAVEGQNNALLLAGIRDSQVLGALVLYCSVAVDSLAEKKKNAVNWTKDRHTVTPRAKLKFDKQVWGATACSVMKITESTFYVKDVHQTLEAAEPEHISRDANTFPGKDSKSNITFTVDLKEGSCNRCDDRHHLQLPCRHIVAALYSQSGSRKTTSGAYRFLHSSYTTAAYVQAVQLPSINLSILRALMPDPRIQPPPLYNQAGRSSHRVQRDVAMREKRIPSRGESKNSTRPKRKAKPATVLADRVATAAKMQDHFSIEIRAAQRKKRSRYTCSHCGKAEGHNSAKCPNRSAGIVDTDVQPGIYLVSNCPLQLLDFRNNAIVYQSDNPSITSEYCF